MTNYTAVRVTVMVCSVIAVALAVVGTLMPFFTMSSGVTATIASLNATIHSSGFNITTDADVLAQFGMLVGGAPAGTKMTLWQLTSGNTTVDLRDNFFTCYSGNMLIQAAEGIAVVTCVLAAADFIMAIFLFLFSAVVKFPLALYFFLSAAAAAVTFGLALNLYLHGWCGLQSLKTTKWDLSFGFVFFVVSCVASLLASILTMFAD